jgi:hypothetical protein
MLTRKFLNMYGLVGLFVMLVLFVLVVFKIVPPDWYLPLFILAFIIWASRIDMRFILKRREKEEASAGQAPSNTPLG